MLAGEHQPEPRVLALKANAGSCLGEYHADVQPGVRHRTTWWPLPRLFIAS